MSLISVLAQIAVALGVAVSTLFIVSSNYAMVQAVEQCYDLQFMDNGDFDVTNTLVACNQKMQDPLFPLAYLTNVTQTNFNITCSLLMNNLLEINEISNTVVLDFYFRATWMDERWNIPGLFRKINPISVTEGLELLPLTRRNDNALEMWRPDIEFIDATDTAIVGESIKLYPNGFMFWSRHYRLHVSQPNFDLAKYPLDKQELTIRFWSYGYTMAVVPFMFSANPVTYVVGNDGKEAFSKNPVWDHIAGQHEVSDFKSYYKVADGTTKIIQILEVKLKVTRDGRGILTRYALPILILVLLAAITFWSNIDQRIDTTMTILLAVSALYVVVIGNIPQVGYSTVFDTWIFMMFFILAFCVCLHQTIFRLSVKSLKYPMRKLILRMIEMTGRVTLVPLALSLYGKTFIASPSTQTWFFPVRILVFVVFLLLLMKELFGLVHEIRVVCDEIKAKIDLLEMQRKSVVPIPQGDRVKLEKIEVYFMNFFVFHVCSSSTQAYLSFAKRVHRRQESSSQPEAKWNESRGASLVSGSGVQLSETTKRKSLYDSDDDEQ